MNLHHYNETISKARAMRLCAYAKIVQDARKALQAICDCPESDCARYVAKVDLIAMDALIALEHALEDMERPA